MSRKKKYKNSNKAESENIMDGETNSLIENEESGSANEEQDNQDFNKSAEYGRRNIDDVIKENIELSQQIAQHRKKMCEDKGIC